MTTTPSATRLSGLNIEWVSLVKRGADPDAHVRLAKAAPITEPVTKEGPLADKLNETIAKHLPDGVELSEEQVTDLNAAFTEATDAVPEGYTKVESTDPPKPEGNPTPAVVDPVEKSADFVALEERVAKAEQTANAEVDARETREAIEKAKIDYGHLAVDIDKLGAAIHRVEKGQAAEGDMDLIKETMAGASAVIDHGRVTGVIGTDASGPTRTGVDGTVEKIAKAAQEKDPTLSGLDARTQAMETDEGRAAYDEEAGRRQLAAAAGSIA